MTYNPGFYSVNSLGEKSLLANLENNIKAFLSWGFLNIGGYVNVQTPQSNITAFNQHLLRPTKDQNRSIYSTWQSPRKDWVHETGICYNNNEPLKFSGVTVNNVFYPGPTGSGAVSYKVDYPNGQIVFTNKIAPTSVVSANYSYKSIQVYKSNDFPSWKEIQLDSSLNTASQFQKYDKGDWSIPAEHRVQLPAVIIETTSRSDSRPFRLGDRSLVITQDMLLHAIADNKDDCNKIVDILRLQEDRFIWLFDTNKVIEDKVYELNFDGSLNVNGKNYYNLVNNPTYQWKLCRISDVTISEIKFYHMNLFGSTIRLTLEIIYDDFDANCGNGGGPVEISVSTDFSTETSISSAISSSMSESLSSGGTSDSTTESVSTTDSNTESTSESPTVDYFVYHCVNGNCIYKLAETWPPDNITYFATLQECENNCEASTSSSGSSFESSSASETMSSSASETASTSISETISTSESESASSTESSLASSSQSSQESMSEGISSNISASSSAESLSQSEGSSFISETVSTSQSDLASSTVSTSASDSDSGSTSESQDCCEIFIDRQATKGCQTITIIKNTGEHCGTACVPITINGNCAGGEGTICGNSVSTNACCTPDCVEDGSCNCYSWDLSASCQGSPTSTYRNGCSCGSAGMIVVYGDTSGCDCCGCEENTCIKSSTNLSVSGCACPDPGPTCTCECQTSTCNYSGPVQQVCLDCVACGDAADQLDWPASQAACDACDCSFANWIQDCVTCCATMETWECEFISIPPDPNCDPPGSCPEIEACICSKVTETTVPCKDCKNESFGDCGGFTICKGCDPTAAGC